MGFKRANINGTSAIDLKNINDNFRNLWLHDFGNIDYADLNGKVQEKLLTVPLQPQGEGNLDSSHPLYIRFFIPDTTTSIKRANLNLITSKYRIDSDITSTEQQKEAQDATTTAATGAYGNGEYWDWRESLGQYVYYPPSDGGTGQVIIERNAISHTHDVTVTVVIPEHHHDQNMGIKESSDAPSNIKCFINDVDTGVNLSGDGAVSNNIDIKANLKINDWNIIKITSANPSRITAFGIIELIQKYN